jgi:hypothetical protein
MVAALATGRTILRSLAARGGASVFAAMPAAIGRKSSATSGLATVHGSTDRPGMMRGTASGISSTVPTAAISMKAAV